MYTDTYSVYDVFMYLRKVLLEVRVRNSILFRHIVRVIKKRHITRDTSTYREHAGLIRGKHKHV